VGEKNNNNNNNIFYQGFLVFQKLLIEIQIVRLLLWLAVNNRSTMQQNRLKSLSTEIR